MAERARAETGPRHHRRGAAISIENLSERLPVPATGDELARLTEVLNSMLARLESAVKTLSQFAADASHELRTPLAVIRTTAELALRRARSPESYRESLAEIAAETERMTQLVEDLLTLARSGTEAVGDAAFAARPARAAARSVRRSCAASPRCARSASKTQLGGQPRRSSPAIAPALHRLFVILLDNAIKYSPAGGGVILTVEPARTAASPSAIEDFGAGISAGRPAPHLRALLSRRRTGEAERSEGHGIGLALADSIARAHGATIEVRSTRRRVSACFASSFALVSFRLSQSSDSRAIVSWPMLTKG